MPYSQGPYSAEGDIVVLCGYLGQLAHMRDAFADKVAVVIDERDQAELADREAEVEDDGEETVLQTSTVEEVKVTRRVCLLSLRYSNASYGLICIRSFSAPLTTSRVKKPRFVMKS